MFNILHYSKCVCYALLTILKEGGGWGWGFWNDSLLLYSELERMVSPAESLSSLLSSKAGNVRGLVFLLHFLYVWFPTWFGLRLDWIIPKGHCGNRMKKIWFWPFHANSNQGTQNFFSSSEDLPSVLICFVRENICLTLAFDTGSESNNSTSSKSRFHKPLWLDWKSLCQTTQYLFFSRDKYITVQLHRLCHCSITMNKYHWTQLALSAFENVRIMMW